MVKSGRPVIVLASSMVGRAPNLITVVALSTVEPETVMPFHCRLPRSVMPQLGPFQMSDSWVKGDMVYSVGFHRLDLIRLNKRDANNKRVYFTQCLSRERMRMIYGCVLHGIGLGAMCEHIPP